MKKNKKLKQLALLGLTNGLLINSPSVLMASNQQDSSSADYIETLSYSSKEPLYAASCKGRGGCGGAVASSCKGRGGCGGAVASSCKGKGGCGGAVASSCKGKGGCGGAVASSCKGRGGCGGAVAERDQPQHTNLQDPSKYNSVSEEANSENLGYHLLTEQELMNELNDNGIKLYKSLTPEGKALAREVASQRCGRTNKCAGLNACETESNKCAGKGKCANTTKCAFADKNEAVKVVADKMAKKRAQSLPNR
jgi:hypothetical protein